jgi:sulfoxide reductase heme-binding subunit YedZ
MVGLFAFFYGSLHFLTYVIVDRFASLDFPNGETVIFARSTFRHLLASVWDDIYKRPYITIGFSALMTMVPLAATSTAGMIRRLGGRAWNRLHKLVYATGILAVVHYYWLVKADVSRPLTYGAIVVSLLAARAIWAVKRVPRRVPAARSVSNNA